MASSRTPTVKTLRTPDKLSDDRNELKSALLDECRTIRRCQGPPTRATAWGLEASYTRRAIAETTSRYLLQPDLQPVNHTADCTPLLPGRSAVTGFHPHRPGRARFPDKSAITGFHPLRPGRARLMHPVLLERPAVIQPYRARVDGWSVSEGDR